ncbi:MAG: glycolate oxidase subunit GlcF, partial [Burkholderiaceae bacterium]|nr:glycolate oxidase subunit GlcF [Burkholderiaceae bacterium]
MQTELAARYRDTPEGRQAEAILRKCVHCGFCNATCPTYQLLGDELDGPRGRIYLIKQVLEGKPATEATQRHLDRCLTCRSCETTCPSGVPYGRLLDIGRHEVERQVSRPLTARLLRTALKEGLTSPLFAPALALGRLVRPLLPATLRAKVPPQQDAGAWPARAHARKMLLLAGCVQPAMLPNIDAATARVFDALGIQLVRADGARCCGAIRYHLNDPDGGLADARANIDAWWPHIEAGAEAIVINASGCGAMVKEYGDLLRDDPAYADKAQRVAALARDPVELLAPHAEQLRMQRRGGPARVVFHPPCTLQHAQRIRGAVEALLAALGAEVLPFAESHLCCGSAGTYSVLQPELATRLRDRKLAH